MSARTFHFAASSCCAGLALLVLLPGGTAANLPVTREPIRPVPLTVRLDAHHEMGATGEEMPPRLQRSPEYFTPLRSIHPDGVPPKNVQNALAEFEPSLITPNSRFDQDPRGDGQALTKDEKEGRRQFKSHGCGSCLPGVNMAQALGIMGDYFGDRGYLPGFGLLLGLAGLFFAMWSAHRNLKFHVAERTRSFQLEITELKATEVALQRRLSRYRSLFENMLEGYAYCQFLDEPEEDFLYVEVNGAFEKQSGLKNVVGKKVSTLVPGLRESNPELFKIYRRVASTGQPERFETYVDALKRWFSVAVYSHEPGHFVVVFDNITERKLADETLRGSQRLLQSTLDALSAHIAILDESGGIIAVNAVWKRFAGMNRFAGQSFGVGSNYLEVCEAATGPCAAEAQAVARGIRAMLARQQDEFHLEYACHSPEEQRWFVLRVTRFGSDPVRVVVAHENVTQRKLADEKLAAAHKQLLENSRQAGMAEVATSVLHNVGNVLNSVNVSSTLVADGIRKSKAANLSKVVHLLRENEAALDHFLVNDPKGRQLPEYLARLSDHLAREQHSSLGEIARLQKNIEHIKDIVTMQQSFARQSGVTETVQVAELLEDALRMNSTGLVCHDIQVVREFEPVPAVTVDKHKVLQILVNLVRNAEHSCTASGRAEKELRLRLTSGSNHVRISVGDNGVGIPPENLTRIFGHGFTTKVGGHGFGLHGGAIAARELGGALGAHSEGAGRGATFTLELPLNSLQDHYD